MEEASTERGQIKFNLDPSSPGSKVGFTTIEKEELKTLAEQHGFPSLSAFLRHMVYLGMNTVVEQDPTKQLQDETDHDAVTVRELIPEGEENAIDVRDELPDKFENNVLDIVDEDPKINREGWLVYR
jgi:hypothetical protein